MTETEKSFVARIWGRTAFQLQVQQYWHAGYLESEWNVFWFRLDDGAWVRFFFDAGVFFWKEEEPSLPDSSTVHVYKLVEPSISASLCNKQIVAANIGPMINSDGRVLGLWFEDQRALYVQNQMDQTSVVCG